MNCQSQDFEKVGQWETDRGGPGVLTDANTCLRYKKDLSTERKIIQGRSKRLESIKSKRGQETVKKPSVVRTRYPRVAQKRCIQPRLALHFATKEKAGRKPIRGPRKGGHPKKND